MYLRTRNSYTAAGTGTLSETSPRHKEEDRCPVNMERLGLGGILNPQRGAPSYHPMSKGPWRQQACLGRGHPAVSAETWCLSREAQCGDSLTRDGDGHPRRRHVAELRAQHVDADAAGRGSVPGESMGSGHGGCRNHPPAKNYPAKASGVWSQDPAQSPLRCRGRSRESARSLSLSPRTGCPSRRTE